MSGNNSHAHNRPPWRHGFIPGVGEVPGGPSSQRRAVRVQTGSSAENEDIAMTSSLISQGIGDDYVNIKAEPVDDDHAPVPGVKREPSSIADEEREIGLDDSAEDAQLSEFPENYFTDFQRMFADHNRGSRSNSDTSRRQRAYGGPVRDRDRARNSSTRDRSRSPLSPLHSPRRPTPMFFPESRRRRESCSSKSSVRDSWTPTGDQSPSGTNRRATSSSSETVGFRCKYPVSYNCSHRSADKLDCRPLVLERMPKWEERDQEDFQRHRTLGLQGERFTTTETLQTILGIVDAFEKASGSTQYRAEARRMERWILKMEDVTLAGDEQQGVASTQIVPRVRQFLSPQNQAVRRRGELPGYIEEELTVLQRKWGRGDFLGAIRRGIVAVDTFDRNGIIRSTRYELDRTYGFPVDAKYFGAGDLVNGQIWMSRLELRRDGVHAPPIAGISGTIAGGARSIVLGEFDESKNKGYADIDMGEVIEYMGTALPDKADSGETNTEDPHMHNPGSWNPVRDPTAATQAMMRSFDTQVPVRVIRSCNMHSIVSSKPSKGYRYDGLYKVVGKTPMKEERQIWSFRLERLPDQGHLRGFQRGEPQPDSNGRRRGHYYQGR